MKPEVDPRIERTMELFSTIYLGGIPSTLTNDSAFLSFICGLSAIEALAGFRYAALPDKPREGVRFERFFKAYFPPAYHPYVDRVWHFRCRMIHAFSPAGFSLTHHHSGDHFKIGDNGNPVLNAEDFYAALVMATQKYFTELRADPELRALMIARLDDRKKGGGINVGPIALRGGPPPHGATT